MKGGLVSAEWLNDRPVVAYAIDGELAGKYILIDPLLSVWDPVPTVWDCTVTNLKLEELETFQVSETQSETLALMESLRLDVAPDWLQSVVLKRFLTGRVELGSNPPRTDVLDPWWQVWIN